VTDEKRSSSLSALLDEFVQSLRPDQVEQLARKLSPDQERLLDALLPDPGPGVIRPWRPR
jgi:hypothetical protein